jgi:hypothetical protein
VSTKGRRASIWPFMASSLGSGRTVVALCMLVSVLDVRMHHRSGTAFQSEGNKAFTSVRYTTVVLDPWLSCSISMRAKLAP